MPILRFSSLRLLYGSTTGTKRFHGAKSPHYARLIQSPMRCYSVRLRSNDKRNRGRIGPKSNDIAAHSEGLKPGVLKKPNLLSAEPTNKQSELLQEKIVSTAEQRKADWAIMKEMTRYLWPKVFPFCYCYWTWSYIEIG
jgi:hypothetical protein